MRFSVGFLLNPMGEGFTLMRLKGTHNVLHVRFSLLVHIKTSNIEVT